MPTASTDGGRGAMASRGVRTLLALGLALSLAGGYLAWRSLHAGPAPALQEGQPALRAGTLLNDSQPLPAFVLGSERGSITNAALQGRWTLVFFGYTYCPDICPTTLATLKEVAAQVAARRLPVPQVLMVSVDPARDTPAQLAKFTAFFDPAFIGATASDEALAPLVKHLGVFYQRHEEPNNPHYLVDHTGAIYLIDPQGRLKAVFSTPQDVAAMVDDYAGIVR